MIFEVVEVFDVLIYIYLCELVIGMCEIMFGLVVGGLVWVYGVEVGMYILKLISVGVFDCFLKFRIVVGYMGEVLFFWLLWIDNCYVVMCVGMFGGVKLMKWMFSDYICENLWVMISGMNYWL